ncbi:hypothetical protein F4819DRAFT_472494 [Hypoxylon fuscum]|nr:hypothetical protein F4819DRAFT_472494 [Hypoxylon fuscum]
MHVRRGLLMCLPRFCCAGTPLTGNRGILMLLGMVARKSDGSDPLVAGRHFCICQLQKRQSKCPRAILHSRAIRNPAGCRDCVIHR